MKTFLKPFDCAWNRLWSRSVDIELISETVKLPIKTTWIPFGAIETWTCLTCFRNRLVEIETVFETARLPIKPLSKAFGYHWNLLQLL